MPAIAIRVENLSKRYRIGLKEEAHDTLAGALVDWAKRPAQNLRRLQKMTRFSENGQEEDDVLWALKDVSFEVKQGEVVGVIGRNGAGKSTLLKILSRITQPTRGRVELHGRVSSLLEVGTGFHPELTGRENIYLNGTILGMRRKEIDQKFDEIVDFSGVEKFIDTPVKRYSSGMGVRLAFSVAAHLEPEILLIDEVLAVGDAEFQKKCLGKMGEVAERGRTILFVSHNMGVMHTICTRSFLLQNGGILLEGETHTVIRKYLSNSLASVKEDGEVIWLFSDTAPGTDEMRLRQVRLLNSSGTVQYMFDYCDQIYVEAVYEVYKLIRGGRMGLILNTDEGETAFASIDSEQAKKEIIPGVYRTRILIPGGLLNQKRYIVHLQAAIPNIRYLVPDTKVLSFLVSGGGQPGAINPQKWPGVVAPKLDWNTEKI